VEWARTSRYCGRCGTATELAPHERAAHCPACGLNAYPRIAPAVIVIVENGDRILLARGAAFPPGMFSALAGFAEPGEPLAETVRREIREEVGIEVRDVRYFDSQPWPFPHSLMIGFFATYAGGELTPDGVEIVEADWFGADGLPNVPPPLSIARRLIDDWLGRTS
jgi:NAD+ diphosphatase